MERFGRIMMLITNYLRNPDAERIGEYIEPGPPHNRVAQRPRRRVSWSSGVHARRLGTILLVACNRYASRALRRRWAVRPTYAVRQLYGDWYTKIPQMRTNDREKFFEYFRMTPERFDEVEAIVYPHLLKFPLNGSFICPGERLALTLRYLASGCDMRTISFAFLISPSTVSGIIRETCSVLWLVLKPLVFSELNQEAWSRIAREFEEQWQFPNRVGALDGKHCIVQAFPNGGTDWYNYKKSFSMVLLALCDANYKFVLVDIGGRGRRSDGGLLRASTFGQMLYNQELDLPPPRVIPGLTRPVPHVIVGDEAFPLTENLMKPFSGEFLRADKTIFNYRLSRARRVIENAFGVLGARWRVLRKTMIARKTTAKVIIKACVVLHNMQVLKESRLNCSDRMYIPINYVDGEDEEGNIIPGNYRRDYPLNGLMDLDNVRMGCRNFAGSAEEVRETFTDYFLGEGQVPWQWHLLPRVVP